MDEDFWPKIFQEFLDVLKYSLHQLKFSEAQWVTGKKKSNSTHRLCGIFKQSSSAFEEF